MPDAPLLCLAIAFAAALTMGRLIRYVHLPNVTAYLVAGLLIGPVFQLIPGEQVKSLSILSDVALGFIAYSIGAEFKLTYLKEIGVKPLVITCFEKTTEWERLEISLRKLEIPREHFMQRWAQ